MSLLALLAEPQAAPADAASSTDVVTLSPADRAAALGTVTERGDRELPVNGLAGQVHGEVGASVDSRGGRALYGATTVPLGQTGSASLFFSTQNGGRWRR